MKMMVVAAEITALGELTLHLLHLRARPCLLWLALAGRVHAAADAAVASARTAAADTPFTASRIIRRDRETPQIRTLLR
jgi:hypothetical protein